MYNMLVKAMPKQPANYHWSDFLIGQLAWGYGEKNGLFIRVPDGMTFIANGYVYNTPNIHFYPVLKGTIVEVRADGAKW